ncbi:protein OCTOPUS-like [Typha latifolia]|uniref:protein OCTOPUS-like n=1 Tax=Typha latifolia TaxID=4733 RepID=UPI003C2D3595
MTLDIVPQQLPQPHPHHRACDLHPDEVFTGFCASCLRERLSGLESARGPSASSAIRSLISKATAAAGVGGGAAHRPELRRCKSFSTGRAAGGGASAAFEPQRRSCDVRGRSTLYSLFYQEDDEIGVERQPNLGFPPPPRVEEEDEDEEIRPAVDPVRAVEDAVEPKPMKEHMDLESKCSVSNPPLKESKEIASSFWLAASVFSKKWQKWRRKQKLKKQHSSKAAAASSTGAAVKPPKPSNRRRFHDTQSEFAVDALGRRSCDTDPRFSLDAGRMSFDDPRFSLDAPRASWDGYLIGGGRSAFSRLPPMLSVVEDAHAPPMPVQRSDGQIPVEEDFAVPGGSSQTRDYYYDSSSRRRRSFERSNSVRQLAVQVNESKMASNAKVSPAGGTEFYNFRNGGNFLDRDLRDFSSNSLRDDVSESFESAFRESHKVASSPAKKSRRWSKAWNIWGFIYRRGSGKDGTNVVGRSFSEPWREIRTRGYYGKILRSNSSASARSSFSANGGLGSTRRSNVETNGHGKKRRDEFVFERNRSARYSPSRIDNGMLRFYLTPMRSSRRNGMSGKGRHMNSHFFTRSMLGLY